MLADIPKKRMKKFPQNLNKKAPVWEKKSEKSVKSEKSEGEKAKTERTGA